ncbi:hypothetical protein GF325_11450 [Candidatus Bathyarchaeota archaeon]|nr:hypothetical protein [Candidatus Bathyarchaeota archaeon]
MMSEGKLKIINTINFGFTNLEVLDFWQSFVQREIRTFKGNKEVMIQMHEFRTEIGCLQVSLNITGVPISDHRSAVSACIPKVHLYDLVVLHFSHEHDPGYHEMEHLLVLLEHHGVFLVDQEKLPRVIVIVSFPNGKFAPMDVASLHLEKLGLKPVIVD